MNLLNLISIECEKFSSLISRHPMIKTFTEWKRDFSVTTLLVNQFCLDHLSTAFQREIETFPNVFNNKDLFQSLTISL